MNIVSADPKQPPLLSVFSFLHQLPTSIVPQFIPSFIEVDFTWTTTVVTIRLKAKEPILGLQLRLQLAELSEGSGRFTDRDSRTVARAGDPIRRDYRR